MSERADLDYHWWAYGDYTGDACPNCARQRLMTCEDLEGRERVICEKCDWEPVIGTYRALADAGREADAPRQVES